MSEAGARIRTRLAGFMRALRNNGFAVGLAETEAAARVVASGEFARPAVLRAGLRAVCATSRAEWERFDEIFDAFWLGRGMRSATRISGAPPGPAKAPRLLPGFDPAQGAGPPDRTERRPGREGENPADGRARRSGASAAETMETTDLRHISDPAQMEAAHELAFRLARRMRQALLRRTRARRRGERLNLRRTIRASIPHGGVPLDRVMRRRKRRKGSLRCCWMRRARCSHTVRRFCVSSTACWMRSTGRTRSCSIRG
jgi:uncharacterized protein with von Willebrand factor type A (vWA) domain